MSAPAAAQDLYAAWEAARARGLNNRAAAIEACVPEAQLIASGCGRGVTRLAGDFAALLAALPALGEIKSVVRNACAVQERTGRVETVHAGAGGETVVRGDTFVLTAALAAWSRAFALTEQGKYGVKRSLQWFTRAGVSAGKIFLTAGSDAARYEALVARHAAADQQAREAGIEPEASPAPAALAAAAGSLAGFLFEASRLRVQVEVTVANPAASQVTRKAFERVKRSTRGGWINVLDEGLDLHLHEAQIARVSVTPEGEGAALHWMGEDAEVALTTRLAAHGPALTAAATVPPR